MARLDEITSPVERELVVSFFDLTLYAKFARTRSLRDGFDFISAYYEVVGDIVEKDDGLIIKFIGDAGLIAYPADKADQAVRHLKELKDRGDEWLQSQGANCRHVIKAHVGPVMCGPVGTKRKKRFDLFGETVMTASVLKSKGFSITSLLYERLNADTQQLFKKHTLPVTYILKSQDFGNEDVVVGTET
jgi:adenylate cyclase